MKNDISFELDQSARRLESEILKEAAKTQNEAELDNDINNSIDDYLITTESNKELLAESGNI